MLRSTIIGLVLLRLAIGWHFFFEGVKKVESEYTGEAIVNARPFTSEGYFRQGSGPLAEAMIRKIGDPDEKALALLTLRPLADGADAAKVPASERMPFELQSQWKAFVDRGAEYYRIDPPRQELARAKLAQAEAKVVAWLSNGKKTVKVKYPSGEVEVEKSTPQRVTDLQFQVAKIRDDLSRVNRQLGRDVKKDLPKTKADVAAAREELLADLAEYTTAMKADVVKAFREQLPALSPKPMDVSELLVLKQSDDPQSPDRVPDAVAETWKKYVDAYGELYRLTPAQMKDAGEKLTAAKARYVRWLLDLDPFTATVPVGYTAVPLETRYQQTADSKKRDALEAEYVKGIESLGNWLRDDLDRIPNKEQVAFLPPKALTTIDYVDWMTRWLLTVGGACLLIGLFTRVACVALGGFLLMTVLTHPSMPWITPPPNSEGYYLFVNKNVIEMLALFVLATVPSGRWVGLDGLLTRVLFQRNTTAKNESAAVKRG